MISLVVIILAGVLGVDYYSHPKYEPDKIRIDNDRYEALLSARDLSEVALNNQLFIGDQQMIYDEADNTFYYSLVEAPSDNSLNTLTIVDGNKVRLALYEDVTGTKILQYNGSLISVSNLVTTTLPVVNVNVSPETVDELSLDDTYALYEDTGANIYLYDNRADFDDKSRSVSSDIKIRMRGGTTIDFPQKSYRITLLESTDDFSKNTKKNLLGLREDDDWILYSAYSDYEKIRTVFSMNLWHDMSAGNNEWKADVSNQYRYVELFFNNRYHGLYALTYPVDKKTFNLKENESLFKKKDWAPSEYSIDLEYQEYEDGSGGYNLLPGYSLKNGEIESYNTLHELYYNIAYSFEPELIRQSVDIDNSIDLWLFYKITQAVDNVYADGVKNLFTATKYSNEGVGSYKLLFAPWDMDQTWGNRFVDGEGKNGIYSYWNATDYDLPMDWGTVPFLMNCQDSDIANQVKERYFELRQTVLSDENLISSIDEYQADIYDSGAFVRTMNRWPEGNYYAPEAKLNDFKNYVLERMKYMDGYIESKEFAH